MMLIDDVPHNSARLLCHWSCSRHCVHVHITTPCTRGEPVILSTAAASLHTLHQCYCAECPCFAGEKHGNLMNQGLQPLDKSPDLQTSKNASQTGWGTLRAAALMQPASHPHQWAHLPTIKSHHKTQQTQRPEARPTSCTAAPASQH
jgi:hypothetical protein